MGEIVVLYTQRSRYNPELAVLCEIMSRVHDESSSKWTIDISKPLWVEQWSFAVFHAEVTFDSVLQGARFCSEQLSEIPDVYYFIHLCVLSGEFRDFLSD